MAWSGAGGLGAPFHSHTGEEDDHLLGPFQANFPSPPQNTDRLCLQCTPRPTYIQSLLSAGFLGQAHAGCKERNSQTSRTVEMVTGPPAHRALTTSGLPAPFPTTDTRLLAQKLSLAAGLLWAPASEGLGNKRSQSRLPGGGSSLPPTSVLWVPGLHCLPRPKPPLPEVPQHHWPVGLLLFSQTSALLLFPSSSPSFSPSSPSLSSPFTLLLPLLFSFALLPSPSSCPFSSLLSPFLLLLPPPSPSSPVPPPRVIWQPDHFPCCLSRKPGHLSPPASVPTPSAGPVWFDS